MKAARAVTEWLEKQARGRMPLSLVLSEEPGLDILYRGIYSLIV